MTPEELLEAQQEQTPLVWSPPCDAYPDITDPLEIVTLHPHGDPFFRWDQEYVARIQRASGPTTVYPQHPRIATAQDLLELADPP